MPSINSIHYINQHQEGIRIARTSSTRAPTKVGHRNTLAFGKESRVAFPNKFDGTKSKFQEFMIQVQLFIELQPLSYTTKEIQVKLIGTLLSGEALN